MRKLLKSLFAGLFAAILAAAPANSGNGTPNDLATAFRSAIVEVSGTRSALKGTNTLVELTLLPRVVTEEFLVSINAAGDAPQREGSANGGLPEVFSFFPPPVPGQPRQFLVDVGKAPVNELTISLVPAGDTPLSNVEVQVVEARWAQ